MKIVCVIPARGGSSRFFEKPLALICGKPMIQWVWQHCKEVPEFDQVLVATDSDKIKAEAERFGADVIMTSSSHDTATERLYEVSTRVEADLYVMVNGDEPLLKREAIIQCIPQKIAEGELYVSNLMTDFSNPVEVVDATNLKIVTAADNRCLFISRSPIPYPKGNMDYVYHKFVGVGAFNRKALEYYHQTPRCVEKVDKSNCLCHSSHTDNARMPMSSRPFRPPVKQVEGSQLQDCHQHPMFGLYTDIQL